MSKLILPKRYYLYDNEVWFSNAYQSLSSKTRDLLQCLLTEIQWKNGKVGGRQKKIVWNNGSISFTERSFTKLTGSCKETYRKAVRELIEKGFIIQTYRGGSGQGDRSTYKLLLPRCVPECEQRWRKYPERNWEKDIPIIENYPIGKSNRFQKGINNKKSKSTLQNKTQKCSQLPELIDTLSNKGV